MWEGCYLKSLKRIQEVFIGFNPLLGTKHDLGGLVQTV